MYKNVKINNFVKVIFILRINVACNVSAFSPIIPKKLLLELTRIRCLQDTC